MTDVRRTDAAVPDRERHAEADPRRAGRLAALLAQPAPWLALVAFGLYLPAALAAVQLSPDAVEYVDIARRLAAGEGYLLGIKAYHFGEPHVVHDGLAERAPLYPLVAAAVLRAGGDLVALQVLNAVLAAACVGLVCAVGAAVFGRRTGALAGLFAAVSPAMLGHMLAPMTEALTIALVLLGVWLVARSVGAPRPLPFALAGIVLGLAYLARPTALILVPALVAGALLAARHRRAALAPVWALLAGFALPASPLSFWSLATRGSLSYSGQTYLYSVFRGGDVREGGFDGGPLPSPARFVAGNAEFVAGAVVDNTLEYLELLFLHRDWLLLLLPAWPLALLAALRGEYPRAAWPVLLAAAVNFAAYALTWSTDQDRYQLATLLLLLPFAAEGLVRLGLGRLRLPGSGGATALHAAALALALAWWPSFALAYRGEFARGDDAGAARTDRGLTWTGPAQWVEDGDLAPLLDWIDGHADRHEILAHAEPWPLTLFTGRPTALLPEGLDGRELRRFVSQYRVAYVVLDTRDRERREYRDTLGKLTAGGDPPAVVGRYRVFDTRPLWR